ncbi:hypothetical protein [Streptomyces sp. RKAG293]|uniref:hypothetical protein n=1 Tax=Streptomyces sp. RKAG293 TaxID=2893403 RepID=UPI00203383D7|nr:hypothetical protein [Streptomyces sp. RKAG293]MCM2416694.1 hypothetical protein [Streptomyces sp. RKAG293]
MSLVNGLLTAAGTTGIAAVLLALAGAHWWLTVAAVICCALVLVVVGIQSVFPQESEHRLAWWRDWRRHQQLRRHGAPPEHPPTDDRDRAPGDAQSRLGRGPHD